MRQFFFKLDKNYILKEAQANKKEELVQLMVEDAKLGYQICYNPLGIEDNTSINIKRYQFKQSEVLDDLYEILAGVYRYQFGDNQLEILFDGRSHFEKYTEDWANQFRAWSRMFIHQSFYVKSIMVLTVFADDRINNEILLAKLKSWLGEKLEVKVRKRRKVSAFKIAGI